MMKKLLVFLLAMFAVLAVMAIYSAKNSTGQTDVATADTPTEAQAILIAQDKVKAQLKSPSTADFEMFNGQAQSHGGGSFTVRDHVDSQNGFGATVRSEYQVKLHYTSGDWADPSNWVVDDIVIQ